MSSIITFTYYSKWNHANGTTLVRILDRLEPVCLGETVEERMASLEDHLERETIYTKPCRSAGQDLP